MLPLSSMFKFPELSVTLVKQVQRLSVWTETTHEFSLNMDISQQDWDIFTSLEKATERFIKPHQYCMQLQTSGTIDTQVSATHR